MPTTEASAGRGTDRAEPIRDALAEAEADAAEAEQLAAEARALADRLQQERAPNADRTRRRRLARPRWTRVATFAVLLLTAALLLAGALMVNHQRTVQAELDERAEFVAAARQVVVTLMSIDFNNPQEDVRRIVDNSSDPFRKEFQDTSDEFIRMAQDAKVITKATANAAAVESMTQDSAIVLVAVASTVTNAEGSQEEPRNWRVSVDLKREGDRITMSKVEFVP